jgi:hypothetical protein
MILTVMLILACAFALADGKQKVVQKNYYVVESYSNYFYFFAKVENAGDAPITLDTGMLVIFDQDDEIVQTENYVYPYPRYLEPGEYAYARDWTFLEIGADDIGDVKFSIGLDRLRNPVTRIPCEAVYDAGDPLSKYDDYIYVTIANTTDQTLFNLRVVGALLDEEGNILYVGQDSMSNLGIHAGSTVTARLYIDSDFAEHFMNNRIVPAVVDALVYIEED